MMITLLKTQGIHSLVFIVRGICFADGVGSFVYGVNLGPPLVGEHVWACQLQPFEHL